MFVKKKRNRSGTTSVVVAEKSRGEYRELITMGVSSDDEEISQLVEQGRKWIDKESERRHPRLDLWGEERERCRQELDMTELVLSYVTNVLLNGTDLILNHVFDSVGFDRIEDRIFRQLVLARLSYPASKAATVEYLKNHFDEDVDLSHIYRYLDKLGDGEHRLVQRISVEHTRDILGGRIGVLFYDVTTLYFEADKGDDLRKTGFSKEGRHANPQIILGLLVSLDGYPLAYCIHPGNKYEGHTMLPVIEEFVKEYNLGDFIVVADSGLMNTANIEELERVGYQYIIGARIKTESAGTKKQILDLARQGHSTFEIDRGKGRRLLVGYSERRAQKDAHNREKGLKRLEKAHRTGKLTKSNVNKRGYNKFLDMSGDVSVKINYDKINEDAQWDGLKGYLTNTEIPAEQVFQAYHNLWNVERSFRIAKSKIEIRPMFHFTARRIEAHVCICFVALKVYKELERRLRQAGIKMSVDKVLAMAKTVTTLQIRLPQNDRTITRTMLMKRHAPIAKLFEEDFWGTH